MIGDVEISEQCSYMRLTTFTIITLCTLYKLTRMTPLLVMMLRERSVEMKLMRARIRLAVFNYLQHLVNEVKISRQLFSETAYKTARQEGKLFSMLVDGLLRLELRENAAEIDVIPVTKTRQAMRVMSYQFETILNSLKADGFMPADAKEKWDEVVSEVRDGADRILWIPNISFRDWLESVKWIRPLRESSRHNVVDLLSKVLSSSEVKRFECGTKITTEGRTMWFLKKGVCRITEWLPFKKCGHRYYDSYIVQGEFIGERNILQHEWTGTRLPLMWPKRRCEATTYCEMVEVSAETIEQLLKAEPAVYAIISNEIQAERLVIELRHARVQEECATTNFWTAFQSRGKSFTKPEHLKVPEGRVGIVGCWTQISLVAPRTAIDGCLHIKGPADLWVEPADPRAAGMVFFEKQSYDDAIKCLAHNSSNISFIHEGPSRKLRIVSAE
ncbi:hypothetical protein DICVIV_08370 [Dictyocaulus viviparus]|uniref:Cyclic nucleotide-binding domain protein n=1 Tax=Dictyocaulus viviparus TaxID=29172 RepID=A0A0D8XM25_DICVI|nr:hypothetical protein DICVIV_08370 [Dictyocaulus viviparus]